MRMTACLLIGAMVLRLSTAWKTIAEEITVEDMKKEKNPWGNPRLQFNWLTTWIYEGVYFAPMNVYTMDLSDFFEEFDYETRHEKDVLDFYIGTSRDGMNFDKNWIYARKPLAPRGPAGSFDKDGVFPPSQFVTHKDEHWIFYGAASERHYSIGRDMKIGLAKLRLKPQWKSGGDLSQLKGKTVKLRFTLHNAKLYSFSFQSERR